MFTRLLMIFLSITVLIGCKATAMEKNATVTPIVSTLQNKSKNACTVTEPLWLKFPADSAVEDPPAFGHYFINKDQSIWASASWTNREEYPYVREEGIKVGWFRPAGATLEITGQRLDGEAPPLKAEVPCCYPTRFQATGLYFPTEGCWEVTARAADRELSFVVWIED
jgi:hypothetical protein